MGLAVSPTRSSAYCLVLWAILRRKAPFLGMTVLSPSAPFIVSMYVPTVLCFMDTSSVIFVACHIDGYVGSPIALLVIFGEG